MTSDLTKSITTPRASKSQHPTPETSSRARGNRDSAESEDADNEDSTDSESESEIGEEVPSGMENDDVGPAEPPEDDEFNIDDEVDINSPVLHKIIGQDSLTTATAKTTASHQPLSANTSFERNDEDFNNLWES